MRAPSFQTNRKRTVRQIVKQADGERFPDSKLETSEMKGD